MSSNFGGGNSSRSVTHSSAGSFGLPENFLIILTGWIPQRWTTLIKMWPTMPMPCLRNCRIMFIVRTVRMRPGSVWKTPVYNQAADKSEQAVFA